jgi:hypothetical protein
MNDGTYTLKMFFSLGGKPSPEVKSKIERNDQALLLREKISATMGKNGWSAAFEEIYKKATDLLDISVVDVLLGAWNRYQALKKYLDKEKYAPTQSILAHFHRAWRNLDRSGRKDQRHQNRRDKRKGYFEV